MPVYYDEKDVRVEFIRDQVFKTGYDSSDFAGYIYMESQGIYSDNYYGNYKKLIDDVAEKFPSCKVDELVEEIASVMRQEENDYIEAWNKKGLTITVNPIHQYDLDGYDDDHYF